MSVLVTGAMSGFGLATARRFAQAAHPIVAASRRKGWDTMGGNTVKV